MLFESLALGDILVKTLLRGISGIFPPMLSSRSFTLSLFTVKNYYTTHSVQEPGAEKLIQSDPGLETHSSKANPLQTSGLTLDFGTF